MNSISQKINELIRSPWQTQFAAGLVLLIALVLVSSTIKQFHDVYNLTKLNDNTLVVESTNTAAMQASAVKIILAASIFGQHEVEKVERINTTLKLSGVVNSSVSDQKLAFISQPDQDAKVYHEGEELSKGLTLNEIFDDRVTLLRYGVAETLYIDWQVMDADNLANQFGRNSSAKITPAQVKSAPNGVSPSFNREEYLEKMRERFKDDKFNFKDRGNGLLRGLRGMQ